MKGSKFIFFITLGFVLISGNVFAQELGRILSLDNAIPTYHYINNKGKKKKKKLEFVDHTYYKLGYYDEHKQSLWVAYLLTKEIVNQNNSVRSNRFRIDRKISTLSATSSDYTKSGYDRGHICPSADMSFSQDAQDITFLMSNISPQVHSFNAGKWKQLEEKVRYWAKENDSIIVIAGPILDSIIGKIGKNNVSIPYSFYKIIIDISYPDFKAIGFIMRNEKLSEDLIYYSVSIREIERRTGLDFFPKFNDNCAVQELETKSWDWGLKNSIKKTETIKTNKPKTNAKKAKKGN
ncbi:MAG TPA: DNA/RNA non-specific endonuclease [Bacteroidales bacterium]|nr:DNA/RNA non-specific endonuclease [Bacteroidales bacterium]